MANIRQTPTGRWQLTVTSKLLPKGRAWFTFDTQDEAAAYGTQVDKWLAAGLVPPELQVDAKRDSGGMLGPIIRAWCNTGQPSAADQGTLGQLMGELGGVRLAELDYRWCERWVHGLKFGRNLAPGSIRKRVQALVRALDWHIRRTPGVMVGNPLHLLPRGYATYTEHEATELQRLGGGLRARVDVARERRLPPNEEAAVLRALAGERRADRERALVPDLEMQLLFALLLGTGMRLREAYRIRVGQIDLVGRALRPQASKAWRGRVQYRGIPLQPHLQTSVAAYLAARPAAGPDALLFSFWDGDPLTLKRATSRLSARFAALFDYAGLVDITQHDLRHEATCRWYEMRRPDGVPLYREAEIDRIMGWAPGSRMAARYASFRAEDLAARLYLAQDQAA